MQPVQDKIPSISAENEMPIHDSCNCCQNVSCCFPRRVKKHKKSPRKHNQPKLDTVNKTNDKSLTVIRKDNRTIDQDIIDN